MDSWESLLDSVWQSWTESVTICPGIGRPRPYWGRWESVARCPVLSRSGNHVFILLMQHLRQWILLSWLSFCFFFPFNKLPIRFFFNWSSQPNIYGRNDYDDIMCTTVELSYVLTFNCLSNRSDNFYLFGLGPSFSVEIFNRRMNHPPIINRIGVIVGLMSWRHSLALR